MAVEAAVGVPAFALFVAMIIMGGRVAISDQSVEAAAFDAARAASIERTQPEAITAARAAARDSLDAQDVHCVTSTVTVNAGAFNAPLGTTGQVSVTVSCKVKLVDLGIPGVTARTLTATASSPIDAYRERR